MEIWEMKLITQVPTPFPVLHFMEYNARSSRVQERYNRSPASLQLSLASSDDNLSQLKRRYNRTKAIVSVNTGGNIRRLPSR